MKQIGTGAASVKSARALAEVYDSDVITNLGTLVFSVSLGCLRLHLSITMASKELNGKELVWWCSEEVSGSGLRSFVHPFATGLLFCQTNLHLVFTIGAVLFQLDIRFQSIANVQTISRYKQS